MAKQTLVGHRSCHWIGRENIQQIEIIDMKAITFRMAREPGHHLFSRLPEVPLIKW